MTPAKIKIHVLPGGSMPKRMTTGAIGYDVCLRALVSVTEMDSTSRHLRKTLFDFQGIPDDSDVARHVHHTEKGYVYRLEPGEQVLAGIGFITEMPPPMFYWVAPRSGLASKHNIQITNAPGTVDPDYRGEAGALVLNRGTKTFDLEHNMRIAQIIFQWALIPEMVEVSSPEEMDGSERDSGGFGSTGTEGAK